MSLVDIIKRALSGEEQEVRCDCTRCIVHRTPSLRGRSYSPEEYAALHAASFVQPEREPWPQEVLDAEKAADQALVDYTERELVWLQEVTEARKRWAQGDRGTDLNDRRGAARGLLDEAAETLSQARAHHSKLTFQVEAQRKMAAAAAALAESTAEVREKQRSRWLELLGK